MEKWEENVRGLFFTLPSNVSVALWNAYLDSLEAETDADVSGLRIYRNDDEFFEDKFGEIGRVIEVVQGSPNYTYNHSFVVMTCCTELISFNDPCVFVEDHTETNYSQFWAWLHHRIVNALEKSTLEEDYDA